MREIDVPIMEQENLTDSIGVRIVLEKDNDEIPIPPTVFPEHEFGDDVYVLKSMPPFKEEYRMKKYHNPNFVINHDHDPEIIPSNPGKKRDPGLISLKGQSFKGHNHSR